jgi:hypothetical protein
MPFLQKTQHNARASSPRKNIKVWKLEGLIWGVIMIVVSFETEKDQKEILDKAVKYFVDNVGLKITSRNDCCARFVDENQLGYVWVTLSQKGKKFEVDVESKEFEYHAKKFVKDFK